MSFNGRGTTNYDPYHGVANFLRKREGSCREPKIAVYKKRFLLKKSEADAV
jgi:hypothetical protein